VADHHDAELLARLRRGDAEAFDAVYAAHKDGLFRFLARLCGAREPAEDLFQETWMRLASHAHQLRDGTNLRAWLYTVARNLHRSQARWRLVDARAVQRLARWWYLDAAAQPGPDRQAVASAALERLRAAFDGLPAAHREVLLLVAGEGLPQDEVAQILGITHEATRQRLARARTALARVLEPEEPPWKSRTISSKA
jgi:RNA polymerase sigma-70 factor (ECF subfamily)